MTISVNILITYNPFIKMKNNMIHFLSITCFAIFLVSCAEKKEATKQVEVVKQAFIIKKQEVSKSLKIPAELLPFEKAELNARVEAFVHRVLVDIGDKVKTGQPLAVLDAPESVARYAEANARFAEAYARFMGSLDRFNRLTEAAKDKGVIAQGELIHAKNQMLSDSSAIVSAKSAAQAYRQILNYLTIRAPFNGIVTSRSVDAGDLVGGSGKKTLFIIERPDKLRLKVHVPESYVNHIPHGDSLTFTADAVVTKSFQARLSRKSGSISPETRTELWEYEYENSTGELKPGMYAMANLHLNRQNTSFVVPFAAVVTSQEKKFVVRVKNNQVEWVDVRQGISLDKGVEIFGDLNEGDTLLVRGSDEIKAGTTLKIIVQ
jgi:RND family efflux transporter MFP subunit